MMRLLLCAVLCLVLPWPAFSLPALDLHPSNLGLNRHGHSSSGSSDDGGQVLAAHKFVRPTKDAFYGLPANLASMPDGFIIRTRRLPHQSIANAFNFKDLGEAHQIFYKFTATGGKPDATVTTVYSSNKTSVDDAGRPRVVMIGVAENSAALDCAPSFALANPKASKAVDSVSPMLMIHSALHQGWTVSLADHEGSKSAWLAGQTSGPAILSATEATLNFKKLKEKRALVALTGYSGGAHAPGWAAQLLSKYAPKLQENIIFFSGGGMPTNLTDLAVASRSVNATIIVLEGAAGLGNAYPKMETSLKTNLNERGQDVFRGLRNGSMCANKDSYTTFAKLSLADLTRTGIVDFSAMPGTTDVMIGEQLGANQPAHRIPTFLVHSQKDEIVPFEQLSKYVAGQCKKKANIELVGLPAGTHRQIYMTSHPSLTRSIQRAFEQEGRGGHGCMYSDSLPMGTDGPEVKELIGPVACDILQKALQSEDGGLY